MTGAAADRLTSGGSEPDAGEHAAGADSAEHADKESRRSRLRGSLNRRRATGISRFAMKNWRIRTRLIALLLLPVMVALVLGGLRVQTSLENSRQLAQMKDLADLARKATALANALQTERDVSAGPITADANHLNPEDPEVTEAKKNSDALSKAFNASADKFDELDLAGGKTLLLQVRKDLNQLTAARNNAYRSPDNIQATITSYDVMIKDLIDIIQDLAITSNSTELIKTTRALRQFSLAKESTSMQRALISAALARPGQPDLSTSDETFGIRLQGAEDNALANFTAIYGEGEARAKRAQMSYNQLIAEADRFTKAVLNPNGIQQAESRSYKSWYDDATAKITAERNIETGLVDDLDGKAQALQSDADTEALINAALVAIVLIVAIAGAALMARSMVRSLTRLQSAAEDVAERRLPELVKTLSESDPQDVDVTVEAVGVDSADEIGHVAHAFDMVHREAVRLAAEQALLRGNINAMFTNLSRRSQGLIQRQLSLISELESREADPDQLASLFKLDHLATRMRRNGENLLVLAGEDPGRRWTRPVPLVDVLRAAASEVEQYERIELAAVPSTEVAGRVVNDLVHLLAELLENATSFSSPQTRVRVTGHALPDGRVLVEIHDTGIGLSPDDLADINERLASPPVVDVSVSRRMGLFVVGRLSLRHGIRIQLRPSDSGGTTALVMLPVDVTNSADRRGGRPGQGGPAGKQQRGAGPTPRQQGRAGAADALSGRQAAALGQGPGGAPGGRPQLGGAPQGNGPQGGQQNRGQGGGGMFGGQPSGGPGAPAGNGGPTGNGGPGAPAGAGLPTREVGQSLQGGGPAPQANPSPDMPPRRVPGASGAPGAPGAGGPGAGGPGGMPRRSPRPQEAPNGRRPAGERPQQRPGAELPESAAPFGERPQHGRADQAPQADPARGGLAPRRPQAPQGPQNPQNRPAQPQQQSQQAPAESAAESTAQFARPRFEASDIDPRDPLGLGLVEPVLPSVPGPAGQQQPQQGQPQQAFAPQQGQAPGARRPQRQAGGERPQPMALPTGPGAEDTQQWFRPEDGEQGDRPRPYQPQRPGTSAPGIAAQGRPQQGHPQQQRPAPQGRPQQAPQQQAPQQQAPQQARQQAPQPQQAPQQRQAPQGPAQPPLQPEAPWRPSANDERWRRAEQLREPSTGGLTTSGLPRRTPQANLVSGTAESSPLTGPQVSRSPEEVRGRLTNLRRGIQQGRQAGTGANPGAAPQGFDGFGGAARGNRPGHDGQRNADGTTGFGPDHQER
ncbi:nitrate- and nitrite sensing domain-containing protein [Kitasatospora sp. NPDC094015]|uniref:nitrate- and nitrite sensing domain-containing protein n=1 Tax=Kitasatospora sp. NPDC094015 TaxID=3155205 RepID=UPI003322E2BB